jgi:DNA-directed RNA polymerase specialized sigma24 family protein
MTAGRVRIEAIWNALRQRNDWELVSDPVPLLAEVMTRLDMDTAGERAIRIQLTRVYGQRLYDGLRNGEEQAAQELWLACTRMAQKRGWPEREAAAIAQEAVARMIERLPTLRDPESVIFYAFSVVRTVMRERLPAEESLEAAIGSGVLAEPVDLQATVETVERKIADQEIVAWLRRTLPNRLEQLVLMRLVLLGDKPRDVARDLNLPLFHTRLAKHRALKRLRDDDDFMRWCRSLRGAD